MSFIHVLVLRALEFGRVWVTASKHPSKQLCSRGAIKPTFKFIIIRITESIRQRNSGLLF